MYSNVIHKLLKLLYPKGRAFRMRAGGIGDRLHKVLSLTFMQLKTDALALLDVILPDNDNFTAQDAEDWCRRLGMIYNSTVPLATTKAAILRKMVHPGTARPRQSAAYIESQLQAAGFNVFVYENRFPTSGGGYVTMTPDDIYGTGGNDVAVYDSTDTVQYGGVEYGGVGFPKIANYLEAAKDSLFLVGNNYRSTFYIAGATISTYADVDAAREYEFRQLVLNLKPLNTVAFIAINYV